MGLKNIAPGLGRRLDVVRDGGGGPGNRRNIVITGPGRSGTTLTCHLLNKLSGTVALSEPIAPGQYADRLPDHDAVCDGIEEYFRTMRKMALREGVVISKHVGGVVPDNTKGDVGGGVRSRIAQKGRIDVGKDLRPGFFLAIKQPNMFTALLPTLAKRFPCFAIIRNPLAIRASSLSIQPHKSKGGRKNPRAIVRYDDGFKSYMERGKRESRDKIDQWLLRTHYIFDRYRQELPREQIIRYEDIVATGGRALSAIVPDASGLDEPLRSKNSNPLYDKAKIVPYGERLLESEGAYWDFYSKQSVEKLLEGFSRA